MGTLAQQIEEASRSMEAEMSLQDLTLSLAHLRENLRYLREDAILISMPTYRKMRAAETAAVSAIARILQGYGQPMPKKTKQSALRCLPGREEGSGPRPKGARGRLRLVGRGL